MRIRLIVNRRVMKYLSILAVIVSAVIAGVYGPSNARYGPERVTNGRFDTDTAWVKQSGWSISGGKATLADLSPANITQTITIVQGRRYSVSFDITYRGGLSPGITPKLGGISGTAVQSLGTHTEIITAGATGAIVFTGDDVQIGNSISIDNVSVRQVLARSGGAFGPGAYQ